MKTNTRTTRTALNLFMLVALLAAALGMPTNALAVQPANDSIFAAVAITSVPSTVTMSDDDFNDAINGAGDPNVCGYGNPGVHTIWYSFTPTSYGKATIDTFGSAFDTIVAVWTFNGGVYQSIACNDDDNTPPVTGLHSSIENLQLLAGTKYYIEVVQYTSGGAPEKQQDRPVDPALISNYMTLNVSYTQDLNIGEPGIKYDDKHAIFTYSGNWLTTNSAKAYAGSFKLSKVIGNSASLTFAGNQFKLYYTKYIQYGKLDIFLDGSVTPLVQLSQTGTTTYAFQQVYTSPVFDNGLHTLQLKHGTKYVSIDAIEFLAPPDVIPPAAITDLAAAPGATYGSVDLTWTASGDDGTDGTAKYYDVRYSPNPITNETTWNAASQATGEPTPKPSGQTETMSVTGYAPNLTYHFAVKVFDEPAPDSTGSGLSNSASATTSGPPPAPAGSYDDKLHADKWVYIGTWTTINTTSAFGGNSYRWANVIGNSASFVFNGAKFTFIYTVASNGGTVDVRLDGVSVGTINMKSSITRYKQKFIYNVPVPGNHTVQFVLITAGRITVDGIIIE